MIIVRNEINEIVEMFDTTFEFKEFLYDELSEMDKGLKEDTGAGIFDVQVRDVPFNLQLKTYLEMTENRLEFR